MHIYWTCTVGAAAHSLHTACLHSYSCSPPASSTPRLPRPPLVTALRAGHSREVISLLVEPVVKHREGRRQDAAVRGLLDDRATRW